MFIFYFITIRNIIFIALILLIFLINVFSIERLTKKIRILKYTDFGLSMFLILIIISLFFYYYGASFITNVILAIILSFLFFIAIKVPSRYIYFLGFIFLLLSLALVFFGAKGIAELFADVVFIIVGIGVAKDVFFNNIFEIKKQ